MSPVTEQKVIGLSDSLAAINGQSGFNSDAMAVALGIAPALPTLGVTHGAAPAGSTFVYQNGNVQGSVSQLLSTFTGLGGSIGTPTGPFNAVEFYLQAWDPLNVPNYIRVRARQGSVTGTILADVTYPLPYNIVTDLFNVPFIFHAYLGTTITPTGNIWLEYFTNGYTGRMNLATAAYNDTQYSVNKSYNNPVFAGLVGSSLDMWAQVMLDSNPVTTVESGGASLTFPFVSSTFSGQGFPIGVKQNFDYVEWDINAFDPTLIPQNVRAQIRVANKTGQVIADKTVPLNLPINYVLRNQVVRGTRVGVRFDQPIANAAGQSLWLTYLTDGRCGFRAATNVLYDLPTYPKFAYSTAADLSNTTLTDASVGQQNLYCRFSLLSYGQSLGGALDYQQRQLSNLNSQFAPTFSFPATIYGVKGRELNIYFRNVCRFPNDSSGYEFDATSHTDLGAAQEGGPLQLPRWTVTPAAVTTSPFSFDVYYNKQKVATSRTVNIVIKDATTPAVSRKVLVIGDSTTDLGAFWLCQLVNLCAGAGITLTTIGARTATNNDAGTDGNGTGAVSRTVHHEGVSGKTFAYHYSDPASDFVFGGVFSPTQFYTARGVTPAANDWIIFMLGINDFFGMTSDAAVYAAIPPVGTIIDAMITAFKAATAGIRIMLCTTNVPNESQDAFGHDYQSDQTQWRYARNQALGREYLIDKYDQGQTANVFVCPIHAGVDNRNNMTYAATAFNYYNNSTFLKGSNGVHPPATASMAYGQIAEQVFALMRGQEA